MKIFTYALAILFLLSFALNIWFFNYFQMNMQRLLTFSPAETSSKNLAQMSSPSKQGIHEQAETEINNDINSTELKVNAIISQFKKALKTEEYRRAAEHIEQAVVVDRKTVSQLKSLWIEDLNELIKSKEFLLAEKSINAFLEFKFDDIELLTFKVLLAQAQHDYPTAIKYAYDIQYYQFDSVAQQESIAYARSVAQKEIFRLESNSLWIDILALVEKIQSYDPDFDFYQWYLSQALFQLGDYNYAFEQASVLLNDSNYVQQAQNLLLKIEKKRQFEQIERINIPLNVVGEHFIASVEVNEEIELTLMIDTGASITTISQRKFDEIANNSNTLFINTQKFNTAGGYVYSNIYQVDSFKVGGVVLTDFQFAVNEHLTSTSNDGLLGMNFLNQFDFYIDQDNQQLSISEK